MKEDANNPFSNLYDISSDNINELIIKENSNKDNCFIYNLDSRMKCNF